jgi:CheY-like chemotaxis protein
MTRHRVLLIDDHDHVRFGLRPILEGQGHAVEEADDGLDGVRKALAWRPDVVVSDIDMPLLDGYGVARQIRRALGCGVRLVALSGRCDREHLPRRRLRCPLPQAGRPGRNPPPRARAGRLGGRR